MDLIEFKSMDAGIFQGAFRVESPEYYPVVDRFYRTQGYKVKTGVNESIYTIHNVLDQDLGGGIIAAARLVPQLAGHFWLRNLLVAKNYRGKGIASALMQQLLPFNGSQGCYCFALPHLENFYRRLGFTLRPEHCPEDIQTKYLRYRARGRDWLLMGYINQKDCPIE